MNRYLYPGVLEELERAHREKLEMDALVAQGTAPVALLAILASQDEDQGALSV